MDKHDIRIIFNSGAEVSLLCDNFKITERGNSLHSYEVSGGIGDFPIYMNLSEVAAIIQKRPLPEEAKPEEVKKTPEVLKAEWIESQLSRKEYDKYIRMLNEDGDTDQPDYETWRKEVEQDVFEDAEDMFNKGKAGGL